MSSYDYLTGNAAAMDPSDNVGKVRKPGAGRRAQGALNPTLPTGPAGSPVRGGGNPYQIDDLMRPDLIQMQQSV